MLGTPRILKLLVPATNDITRGWCRLMGVAPLMLLTMTLLIVRNLRILAAWNARQEENQRRAAKGLPAKTRRRFPMARFTVTFTRPVPLRLHDNGARSSLAREGHGPVGTQDAAAGGLGSDIPDWAGKPPGLDTTIAHPAASTITGWAGRTTSPPTG